jgi:hypothetical protein
MRITGAGNVGIGTTSPGEKLEVNGGVRSKAVIASDWAFVAYNNSNAAPSGIWFDQSDGELLLRNRAGTLSTRIRSNNSSYFNGGNVGIGTTSPGTKLYVDGGESTFNRGNSDGAIARFRGKNAEKAVIGTADSWFSGSVGIGTTAPRVKLHVQGGVGVFNVSDAWHQSSQGTNILRGGGFNSSISEESTAVKIFNSSGATGKAVGNYWGGISFMHLDPQYSTWGSSFQGDHFWIGGRIIDTPAQERSALVFAVNSASAAGTHSSEKMVILPNGNVGIGTTSPSEKLEVSGGDILVRNDSTNIARISLSENTTDRHIIMEYDGTGAGAGNYFTIYSDVSGWMTKGSSLNIQPSTGNVGIGTASPGEKLHVVGAIKTSRTTGASENTFIYNQATAKWGSSTYPAIIESVGNNSFLIGSSQNTPLHGNVGIGTTSPGYKLEVSGGAISIKGNAAGNSLRFDDSGGTSRNAMYVDTSNYLNIGNSNYAGVKFVQTATMTASVFS